MFNINVKYTYTMELEFGGNESLQTYSKELYRLEKYMQIRREEKNMCL
jgi:hypothetical protein